MQRIYVLSTLAVPVEIVTITLQIQTFINISSIITMIYCIDRQLITINGERFAELNFCGFQEHRECFPVKITSFV